jgi:Protein of unknown function (DUF1579)
MSADSKISAYLEEHPVQSRPVLTRKEPSPRLRDLDFLLGNVVSQFDTGVRFECSTRPILGGLYLEMTVHATYADGSWRNDGVWIIGWNEVDQVFQSYYFDALGNQGTSTSPGWTDDGALEFVGSHIVAEVGVRTLTKDRYLPVDDEHFLIEAYVQDNGEWKLWNTQDCHRTEPSKAF